MRALKAVGVERTSPGISISSSSGRCGGTASMDLERHHSTLAQSTSCKASPSKHRMLLSLLCARPTTSSSRFTRRLHAQSATRSITHLEFFLCSPCFWKRARPSRRDADRRDATSKGEQQRLSAATRGTSLLQPAKGGWGGGLKVDLEGMREVSHRAGLSTTRTRLSTRTSKSTRQNSPRPRVSLSLSLSESPLALAAERTLKVFSTNSVSTTQRACSRSARGKSQSDDSMNGIGSRAHTPRGNPISSKSFSSGSSPSLESPSDDDDPSAPLLPPNSTPAAAAAAAARARDTRHWRARK